MANTLTDKVAIVTGAGRIGRGIALTTRGPVNDLGGAVDGTGTSSSPADEVVAEIKANGGEAVANYNSVATMDGGEAIVQSALDNLWKAGHRRHRRGNSSRQDDLQHDRG